MKSIWVFILFFTVSFAVPVPQNDVADAVNQIDLLFSKDDKAHNENASGLATNQGVDVEQSQTEAAIQETVTAAATEQVLTQAKTEASVPQKVDSERKKEEDSHEGHDHSHDHDGHDHSHDHHGHTHGPGEEPHSHDSVNPNDPKHKDCKFHKAMGWFKRLFGKGD